MTYLLASGRKAGCLTTCETAPTSTANHKSDQVLNRPIGNQMRYNNTISMRVDPFLNEAILITRQHTLDESYS